MNYYYYYYIDKEQERQIENELWKEQFDVQERFLWDRHCVKKDEEDSIKYKTQTHTQIEC